MDARIVIVDNDERMRDLFTACLMREGGQVFSSSYAHIDLATLERHRPDLIILDFNVRDDGIGWELLQLLKMNDATARIPMLITTSTFLLSAEVQSYLSTLFIRVVHKPFRVDELLTLVQSTLTLASQADILFSSELPLPILVVDDTESLRDNLVFILTMEGYPVATASNGRVALDAVSQADHSLILLDISMPIMNGLEFLSAYNRQLRPHSPVIIISGEADIPPHALPSFVVNVMPKPAEIPDLLKLVGKYAQPA